MRKLTKTTSKFLPDYVFQTILVPLKVSLEFTNVFLAIKQIGKNLTIWKQLLVQTDRSYTGHMQPKI